MIEELQHVFIESFDSFLRAESNNIMNGVAERNLCGRLAYILEPTARRAGFHAYYADTEYNRKQDGRVKTIIDDEMQVIPITCDLILHSRGENIRNDNLIAIEMKRIEHLDAEKRKDRIRLRALTKSSYNDIWSADGKVLPEHVCGYSLGYFVELDRRNRRFGIEEYQEGETSGSWVADF